MATDDSTGAHSGLADAIRGPLDAGDLEGALRGARTFHMRNPGAPAAKRCVEALELLMSQVWLGSGEEHAALGAAAAALDGGRIAEALERYRSVLAQEPEHERALRLAHRAQVVVSILGGLPLPRPESSQARLEVAHLEFGDSTRVAGAGELPVDAMGDASSGDDHAEATREAAARAELETLDALAPSQSPPPMGPDPGLSFDDVTTAAPDAVIPGEAFGDGGFAPESTRHLNIGDYEVIDDEDGVEGLDAVPAPPALPPKPAAAVPPPARRKKKAAPVEQFKETTRVAGPGELPLDQLRREIEAEQSDQLDAFLGDMVDDVDAQEGARPIGDDEVPASSPPAGPAVPPPPSLTAPARPKNEPRVPADFEASLQLDITVMPELLEAMEAASSDAPPSSPPSSPPPAAPAPHPAAGPSPSELPAVLSPELASAPPASEPAPPEAAPSSAPSSSSASPAARAPSAPPRGPVVPPPPAGPPVPAPPAIAPRRERGDATLQTGTGVSAAPISPPVEERVSAPPLLSAPAPHVDAGPPPNDRISALPAEPAPPPVDVGDVHAPIDTSEISISQAPPRWEEATDPGPVETSWAGVRVFDDEPPAFAAGTEGVDADRWDDVSESPVVPRDEEELAAEALIADGRLRDALHAYQDLAAKRPSEQRLWDKVAHIARMLQERSK